MNNIIINLNMIKANYIKINLKSMFYMMHALLDLF